MSFSSRSLRSLLAGAVLFGAGVCLAAVLPQDSPARMAPPAPAPEVARLLAMEGLWDIETVFTGRPATTGLAKLHMLGGTWLIEEFKGEFGGQPFEGHGITGWDPAKQRYVNAWVDTAGTELRVVEMVWDEGQKSLTVEPQLMDFGSGPTSMRGVTRVPDADTMIFTLTPAEPDALPFMTITYTRNR